MTKLIFVILSGLIVIFTFVTPSRAWCFNIWREAAPGLTALKGWESGKVGYSIVLGLTPSGMDYKTYSRTIMRAFNTWTGIPESGISAEFRGFISVIDREAPETYYSYRDHIDHMSETFGPPVDTGENNVVSCRNSIEASGYAPEVIAYTAVLYDVGTFYLAASDIFINTNPEVGHQFCIGAQPGKYDLQSILTHEAGFFIGLAVSWQPSNMGLSVWPDSIDFRELAQDDIDAATYLYPRDISMVTGSAPTPERTYTGLRDTVTGLWPGEDSLPDYGPEPVIVDPDLIDISDPLVGGDGGGGGCSVSKGKTHSSGFLTPFFLLIAFAFVNCIIRKRQLT